MKRSSGVLLHVSSLWGKYSCGSFGSACEKFIDFLAEGGFSYWQTLPFCLPDDYASPYSSYSAFSVNPFFIDLPKLHDNGLLTNEELEIAEQRTPYGMEFDRLKEERLSLLQKAAERYTDKKEIASFLASHPHTERFCHFMAMKAAAGTGDFRTWKKVEEDEKVLRCWEFICFIFMKQWKDIRAYAANKGVKIVGDIPFYVSLDSSDVWENPKEFLLDRRRMPTSVAGVPPDYFCPDGQLWGNPLYNWKAMEQNGFKWWRERVAFMCELFDCVRIDHFRGIESYFSIPASAESAKEGVWKKGPGMKFVSAIKEASGGKLLIAEDLGVITDKVRALVKESGFPGMRVLQFGFDDDASCPHLPHNYDENCVAYTGTHDNNTLLGFMWEASEQQKNKIAAYCGFDAKHFDEKESYRQILMTVLRSKADLVIFPLQDLLLYGVDTRMNVPGKGSGNWCWRFEKSQLDEIDTQWWLERNRLFGRI